MPDLALLPDGAMVGVDANILVYHFESVPGFGAVCTAFVRRIEAGEIGGVTTTAVVSDVIHRLMCSEGARFHGLPIPGMARRLQEHPDLVRPLTEHSLAPQRIRDLGVVILPMTLDHLLASREVRAAYGLMTGDSLLVAAMRAFGITDLATNNGDFDLVGGITCWKPPAP